MKENKQTKKDTSKEIKVFKPLSNQQLESVIGGPETSRGTETNVQHG